MMRSLWTAASGMKSQQLYVDSIANNNANVNTAGFKKDVMEFRSLFYETLSPAFIDENGIGKPVGVQIGHGVRVGANYKDFSQGSLDVTNNPLDFSLEGNGFFMVEDVNGDTMFTKQGGFKISIVDDQLRLVTSDGYSILSTDGDPIDFDSGFLATKLTIDSLGNMSYINPDQTISDLGYQLGIVQFKNPAGLSSIGGAFYKETSASGGPIYEAENDELQKTLTAQGSIEASNVQVVEEMVKMIVAQRAYEMNSKSIQTSDDMLALVNQLKR
jgi:flagellar basal-body rod protein FlgG